jgi:hypothetical protein
MEVEQRYVIKFSVEESMKGVEIIDRLNKHYGQNTFSERRDITGSRICNREKEFSNILPPGRVPDEGLDNCIGNALKEDFHFQ